MNLYVQETWWQSGVGLCIMPGMPTHLVQESNVDIVYYPHSCISKLRSSELAPMPMKMGIVGPVFPCIYYRNYKSVL